MKLGGVIHLNKSGICVMCGALLVLLIYMLTNKSNSETHSTQKINLKHLLKVAIKAAENGGNEVVVNKDNLKIKSKGLTKEGMEDSVTTADYLSHCSIMGTLKHAYPTLNVISEEAKAECNKNQEIDFSETTVFVPENVDDQWEDLKDITVWIDPLDATHEYTEKLYDNVTTMVCVAVKGQPIIGVIHKPFMKDNSPTFWAWNNKAKSSNLKSMKHESDKLKIIISRSHKGEIQKVLGQKMKTYDLVIAAGAGYKALEVATGKVDAYLHITAIKKWDICAGNAIINAMGAQSIKTKAIPKFSNLVSRSFSDKYLFYTNVGLSVTLSGVGDILVQNYEILTHELEGWNKIRTRNMSICGMTIGIFCHHWYNYLDRRLPGYAIKTVAKKIIIDQIVCSPICIATLFLTSEILEQKSKKEMLLEVKQKAWMLYVAEWVIWPPAQFINFYFLPTRFRVLYDNTISLGYDVYTSY
ncbi:inositol monophosphatase 3, partial [Asbolus verrucosus]